MHRWLFALQDPCSHFWSTCECKRVHCIPTKPFLSQPCRRCLCSSQEKDIWLWNFSRFSLFSPNKRNQTRVDQLRERTEASKKRPQGPDADLSEHYNSYFLCNINTTLNYSCTAKTHTSEPAFRYKQECKRTWRYVSRTPEVEGFCAFFLFFIFAMHQEQRAVRPSGCIKHLWESNAGSISHENKRRRKWAGWERGADVMLRVSPASWGRMFVISVPLWDGMVGGLRPASGPRVSH